RRSTLWASTCSSLNRGTAISTTGGAATSGAGMAPMVGSGWSSCMVARCRGPVRADPGDCKNRSRSAGSCGWADAQDCGTVDLVVGQVRQCGGRVVEGVGGRRDPDRDLGGKGQEFLAVPPGVGGDAPQLAFVEQVVLVAQRRD